MKSAYCTNHTQQRQGANRLCYGEKMMFTQIAMIMNARRTAILLATAGIVASCPRKLREPPT
ncbi:hypothetical protein [Shigella sonnei]|uniref:hypothetical protein n=1 Tax=Shigella sonnei TaxID=624 RepID=UPI001C67E83C|nr:hypothetical protein [Shigella sonnei]